MTTIRISLSVLLLTSTLLIGCGGSGDKPAPDASSVKPISDDALQQATPGGTLPAAQDN